MIRFAFKDLLQARRVRSLSKYCNQPLQWSLPSSPSSFPDHKHKKVFFYSLFFFLAYLICFTERLCMKSMWRYYHCYTMNYPKYPVFSCNKTRHCAYIHRVKITEAVVLFSVLVVRGSVFQSKLIIIIHCIKNILFQNSWNSIFQNVAKSGMDH